MHFLRLSEDELYLKCLLMGSILVALMVNILHFVIMIVVSANFFIAYNLLKILIRVHLRMIVDTVEAYESGALAKLFDSSKDDL